MKVTLDSYNKLLQRRDVVVAKNYPSNPGFATVKQDLAAHFTVSPDCVVVLAIHGGFGSSEFRIEARVYDSVEALQSVEPKPKVKKVGVGT